MKHLHEVFEDTEYEKLKVAKGKKHWHEFILEKCLGEKPNIFPTKTKLYRWFRYFQNGFALLSLPLSVINFATIFYYLLVEKVSALTSLFPSFTFFLVASILIFTPLSTALGW